MLGLANMPFKEKDITNILNGLFVIFFVLSFFNITYKLNIYVLYSVLFIPFLLKIKLDKCLRLYLLIFICIFFFQFLYHGSNDAFRVYKTFAVLLPIFFCNILTGKKWAFFLLDVFVYLNVAIVYIDFFLFFTIGITLTPIGISGVMPRIGALTEDSNFYSYLIMSYSFLKIAKGNRIPVLCLISILLSGSFAAIFVSVVLLLFYKRIDKLETDKNKISFRNKTSFITIIVFLLYFILIYYSDDIIYYLESLGMAGLLKVKIISMSHRFLVQNESMLLFLQQYNIYMGAGAGETINLNSLGLNLHNSYCQLFLESGLLCFLLVLSVLTYMGRRICNLKNYILFCAVFLLGCMMEVLYFPLLSFIYYYEQTNADK